MGALTSKIYSFSARPWELVNFIIPNFIDTGGSFIRLDFRGNEIMRILPQSGHSSNLFSAIISDRLRFGYDGYVHDRLIEPFLASISNWYSLDWEEVFNSRSFEDWPNEIIFANTSMVGVAQTVGFNQFINSFNGFFLPFQNNVDFREYFVTDNVLAELLSYDLVLCVAHSPFDILQNYMSLLFKVCNQGKLFSIGFNGVKFSKTLPYSLSVDYSVITNISCGQHKFCTLIVNSMSTVIFCDGKLPVDIFDALQFMVGFVRTYFIRVVKLVLLNFPSNAVNTAEFNQCQNYVFNDFSSNCELDYFFGYGADDFCADPYLLDFSVYVGSHFDRSFFIANLSLPTTYFLEEASYCYNERGMLNQFNAPLQVFSDNLRSSSKIERMVFLAYLNKCFSYKQLSDFFCQRFFAFAGQWVLAPMQLLNYAVKIKYTSVLYLYGFSESYYSNSWFCDTMTRASAHIGLAAQNFIFTI
jgi:NADH-quinone oxidoreductase subunit G